MDKKTYQAMIAPVEFEDIGWRIISTYENNGLVVPYINARAIQDRLDAVLGPENWQSTFTSIPASQKEPGGHICRLRIYYPETGLWITKSDGAGSTAVQPIKGGISDAFKRAAAAWGIGRYLYKFTPLWVKLDRKEIAERELPRLRAAYTQLLRDQVQESPAPQKATPGTPAAGSPAFQVSSVKVFPSGKQTYVEMQARDGASLAGFIKGKAPLTQGQWIRNIQIVQKEDPTVGRYNIISHYENAA